MEDLFNTVRKYKVGLVIAHQNLDQFEQRLRATVMASTSIKMVGGLSAHDAYVFAKEMRCGEEFLQSMRKYKEYTEFACNVRNFTPHPVRLTVPFGRMEEQPRISEEGKKALLAENRERYCAVVGKGLQPQTREAGQVRLEGPEIL